MPIPPSHLSLSISAYSWVSWINFMLFELSELYFWPSRDGVDEHFPANVQQMFPSKRVILDATEWRFRTRVLYANEH